MKDILASYFWLDVLAVETIGVLVNVRAVRRVETESIRVRPGSAAQLAEVHGWLACERCI